jgi:hypothetical protein
MIGTFMSRELRRRPNHQRNIPNGQLTNVTGEIFAGGSDTMRAHAVVKTLGVRAYLRITKYSDISC